MSSADALAFSTYNTLMMTWKKPSETVPQTFPTCRPCMPTFIIKFTIYYTISSAHPPDASDMIDRITLVYVLDQRLSYLKVEPRTLVPYGFFCGIFALDEQNIMVNRLGIQQVHSGSNVWLCSPVSCLRKDRQNLSPTFDWSDQRPMN